MFLDQTNWLVVLEYSCNRFSTSAGHNPRPGPQDIFPVGELEREFFGQDGLGQPCNLLVNVAFS